MATVIAMASAAMAAGAVPHGDLLGNPGAEEASTLPWVPGGPFSLINYGTGAYPATSVSDDIDGGCAFFTGGKGAVATGQQVVDLSGISEISSPGVTATLSGYLGGFLVQDDNARVDVVFLHGGSQVGSPLTIGPVLAADRANRTTLLLRTASATVPSNADGARVTVTVTRAAGSADPQDNDGYADNLALTLDGSVPAPPHTNCLPDRDDDGFATDTDCDDGNPAIHPGARDVPGNARDEDCEGGPAPYPLLASTIAATFDFQGKATKLLAVKIGRIRKGSTLRMACSGRGCPFRARTVKLRRNQRKLTLAHPLGDARLARGTRFTVTITRQGMTGIVARYTMRVKRFPARTDRCLPPGAKHPARCAV